MRKRNRYRPNGVRLDSVTYVLTGMKPVTTLGDANHHLRL